MCRTKEDISKYQKEYRLANKEKQKEYDKNRYIEKRKYFENKNKNYYENNKETIKKRESAYYLSNKESIKVVHRKYINKKRKNDIAFHLHSILSMNIRVALRLNNSSKNGISILKSLPYTMLDLKQHLEQQFEPWMNWKNWGKYSKTWNDDNPNTWTWQIDHITPRSKLPYFSVNDNNFKKCWSLDNLRCLSSKENILKGNK